MKSYDFTRYNRIMIIGCMGSGKSWLSKRVAEITAHPLYHLDVEHWQPGWVKHSREEQIARQKQIIRGEKWIIDGTWGRTMEIRYKSADLVIFLEINRLVCMWSAARRTGKKRSDLPEYLEERGVFSREFFQFCKWIWVFPRDNKGRITALREKYPHIDFLHIKSRREVNKLVSQQSTRTP